MIILKKKDGETALYAAAAHGHESVAALLIAARCNVDLATEVYIYKKILIYICNIKSRNRLLPSHSPSLSPLLLLMRMEIFLFFSCLFIKIFFLI